MGMQNDMKKKLVAAMSFFFMTFGSICQVEANQVDKTVALTEENEIVYADGDSALGKAFADMAPGDERTVVIRVENHNSHKASFFISQDTVKSLEEGNTASGGAYEYGLSVGNTIEEAESLLDTVAGGYVAGADDAYVGSNNGLSDIKELEGYQFIADLESGASTNVYLTLYIDGEGFDSGYANTQGEFELNFRAYYEEREPVVVKEEVTRKGQPTIVQKIVDELVPLGSVKTGDVLNVAAVGGILLIGVVIICLALKKRRVER